MLCSSDWELGVRLVGSCSVRARLIVNPKSGADRAPDLLPLINARLRTLVRDLDITLTVDAQDAERAAARALAEGCDALYVAGGDGTLNAALRGLMTPDGTAPSIVVGLIPLGTGNDFAKALGLGEEPQAALDLLLDARVISVDVGMLNNRPFVNTSAGGFVADVSETVTEGLKDATGKLAYLIGGARALFGTEPFSARLLMHDAVARPAPWAGALDLQMFAICNARFIGGGYPIAPDALIDDGLLDVLVVPRMPKLEFVGVLQRIAAGDYRSADDLIHFHASAFDLEFSRTVRVNTDGEVLEADGCRYRVRPGGARFFCGPTPSATAPPVPRNHRGTHS
jgi:diacylglycerol kinase (ATP)